jgi:hypothetical protein
MKALNLLYKRLVVVIVVVVVVVVVEHISHNIVCRKLTVENSHKIST